jgi:biotin-(acetyl-CoA carboxylase) ligase
MSLNLRPSIPLNESHEFPNEGCCLLLNSAGGMDLPARIKSPNEVLINDKKIADYYRGITDMMGKNILLLGSD